MSEYQTSLGSAASVDAGALGGADDHHIGKVKRRASSARRAAAKPLKDEDRSRSPERGQPDRRAEVAERAILAPLYVEPGSDGDAMGVEGRHRHNMQKMFGFMAHVEKVLNNHADYIDGVEFEQRAFKRASREQALETKSLESRVVKADREFQRVYGIAEVDHLKLKEDVVTSVAAVWEFLSQNNCGIMQLFQEADAAVKKVKLQTEETLKDMVAAQLLQPSSVASGPKGLAFVGLRA